MIAFFDVTNDVFDHHDRIIDYEASRNSQSHQGQIVQAVAEQIHDTEGADQRQWNSNTGDDRGCEVAQEQKDHHHHQRDGEHQLDLHVPHRGANGIGPIC